MKNLRKTKQKWKKIYKIKMKNNIKLIEKQNLLNKVK